MLTKDDDDEVEAGGTQLAIRSATWYTYEMSILVEDMWSYIMWQVHPSKATAMTHWLTQAWEDPEKWHSVVHCFHCFCFLGWHPRKCLKICPELNKCNQRAYCLGEKLWSMVHHPIASGSPADACRLQGGHRVGHQVWATRLKM